MHTLDWPLTTNHKVQELMHIVGLNEELSIVTVVTWAFFPCVRTHKENNPEFKMYGVSDG